MATKDALTYRPLYEQAKKELDSANMEKAHQYEVIRKGNKTIQVKEESAAFEKSKGDMLAKENEKLTWWNQFWRMGCGLTTGVAAFFIIKSL